MSRIVVVEIRLRPFGGLRPDVEERNRSDGIDGRTRRRPFGGLRHDTGDEQRHREAESKPGADPSGD